VTTVAERIQLDDITAQARQVRFGRVLLTVLAAVFFAIGWAIGRVFLALVWCGVAVKVGWQAGAARGGPAQTG
jgi:uncharacterized membrane protein YciS (DUF1049 family)